MSLKIQVSSKGYALLSSWWDDVTAEVKESYPDVETTVVAWEVVKVDASAKKAFVMFPSLMESHWKAYDYFKQSYVMTRIPEGFVELSFHDFYAAEGKTIAQQLCFFIKDYQRYFKLVVKF